MRFRADSVLPQAAPQGAQSAQLGVQGRDPQVLYVDCRRSMAATVGALSASKSYRWTAAMRTYEAFASGLANTPNELSCCSSRLQNVSEKHRKPVVVRSIGRTEANLSPEKSMSVDPSFPGHGRGGPARPFLC